ncbi:MAG: M55 family metallopeptidase [Planctomycetes bacterium]|nr:M55 family metallopeptidase [Planctomycetota bacterium]
MKIFMETDLEGVAGVVSFEEQCFTSGKYYEEAKLLLTAEVNAAIEGLLEAGVEEILVNDGHGVGGICFAELHPRAQLIHGRPSAPLAVQNEVIASCDAAMIIGQHAMVGTERGCLHHTQNHLTIEYYKLNGQPIGEIAQVALHCGALGVPMIFLSGDQAACREAQELIPGITTAIVKQGLNRTSAISCPAPEAHRRIREGAQAAIKKHHETPLAPLVWQGPFVLEKRYLAAEHTEKYNTHPLATRIDDKTIQLTANNILEIIFA